MKRLLVPTDFTDIAEYGLTMALQIAKQCAEVEIYLLNIITPPESAAFSSTGEMINYEEGLMYASALRKANQKKINSLASQYRDQGVRIVPAIIIEHMQDGIQRFIDDYEIDLVVMGTSRQSTFEEYFIGNHTEQVMRVARCPVIAVKEPVKEFKLKDILLTLDLKSPSEYCIKYVKDFAEDFQSAIHLLYVSNEKNQKQERLQQLEQLALKCELTNYTVNVISERNKEAAIIRFAKENHMDMIASITHGRSGFAHLILGSISEDLVKDTDLPVFSINSKAA
jgi:nucleotide-binding universal stress UspA family protein